jgi:hypothetical protein
MPIASEQFELPSFSSRITMDAETRCNLPPIRERTEEEEEDELALSEGENNDRAEMASECTPRWLSVARSRAGVLCSQLFRIR